MKPATTISKVCRVLGEFRQRPSLGVTDLARRTGLLPSDVHRILASLKHCGFVEQNPQTKTYRLGVSMMKLGLAAFQRNELREAARPLLLRLSEEVEATAHLAIFDPQEFDIFLADQFDTSAEIPFKANFGATAAAHCTALGKAIMANIDHELALRYLEQKGTPRSAPNTMTQLALIEAELRKTQKARLQSGPGGERGRGVLRGRGGAGLDGRNSGGHQRLDAVAKILPAAAGRPGIGGAGDGD
jgi:DNA-binding IclR family transcriptional regulator